MEHTAATQTFEEAARYEPELTARQREVLRLIAAGKTNAEIADVLDMTLAGAKWHVSELLTKLALESREAAAAYYRWRERPHRRLARRLRGLVSASALKIGLGTAGAAGALAIGGGVFLAMQADEPPVGPAEPGLPFYMEAKFTRTEEQYATEQERRFWYQDATHLRVEVDSPPVLTRKDPGFEIDFESGPTSTHVELRDGAKLWTSLGVGRYWGRDLQDVTSPTQALDLSELGPIPEQSMDAFVARLQSPAAGDGYTAEVRNAGSERLLGITLEKIEVTIHDIQGKWTAARTYWIDPARMLILKFEARIAPEWTQTETATRLVYGQSQPADKFVWVPAPGSIEDKCMLAPGIFATGQLPAPFFRIPVSSLPPGVGFRTSGSSSSTADGACVGAQVEYASAPDPAVPAWIHVRQDAADPASVLRMEAAEEIAVGAFEGRIGEWEGRRALGWVQAGVGVQLSSTALTDEELRGFAEDMVAAESTPRAPTFHSNP